MFLQLLLALTLIQIPDAPKPKPQAPPPEGASSGVFELQGDALGETLETFVSRHAKAQCDDSNKPRVTCYQWTEVAIFGLSANAGTSCSLKKRYAADCIQGITAHFSERGLISLVYAVGAIDRSEATVEMKKKFGAASKESRDGTVWNKADATASVVIGKATDSPNDPTILTVTIRTNN